MSERLAALSAASDANATANEQLTQQLDIRFKHVADKEYKADKKIQEIDKTSEAYIQNAESALANIRETEANLQERERQIQLKEESLQFGLQQLQMNLVAQQGIPINPMQSSGSMGGQQYPIQYPIQLQLPYGGQSSGSMSVPQDPMQALNLPPVTRVKRQSLAIADMPASAASSAAAASAAASAEEANPEMAGTNLIKQSDSKWSRAALPTLQRQLQLRGVSSELIARKPCEQLIAMILQRDDR